MSKEVQEIYDFCEMKKDSVRRNYEKMDKQAIIEALLAAEEYAYMEVQKFIEDNYFKDCT